MLNLFTKLKEFFARAAEPDEPDDFDPDDPSIWGDSYPRLYPPTEPERNELYANIGGRRIA